MPAKRKGRRKNRRIKFSESNYVEKNYMQRGKAVIPIKLEKISDLYMKHDYKQMELSDSVCNYIEEIAYMVPINTDIILEIHCPEIDEELQNKIKKNIKNNYGMEIDDNEYDLSTNNKRALIFAAVGIIVLILHILVEDFGRLFADLLSVVWWVAIWDMVEIFLLENQEIKWKRLNNQQLYDSTIRFVFDAKGDDKDAGENLKSEIGVTVD
ncbi:MAG: hypothetical protein J6A29_01655 [Clostridia bacterium]|nr:hypothetical protein [Clostridia bacterium]